MAALVALIPELTALVARLAFVAKQPRRLTMTTMTVATMTALVTRLTLVAEQARRL